MTNPFATDFVFRKLGQQRFLEVDNEGIPLQKQVGQTHQVYSGQGGESIVYDGSNVFVVENALTTGDLTLDLSAMHNYYGRSMHLIIKSTLQHEFIMDFGDGSVIVPGVPYPLGTTITPAGFGPLCGVLNFFAIDEAALIKNPLTLVDTITPGDEGQVLTTVGGTAEWADLPSSGAQVKSLYFNWKVDASNELNDNTGKAIIWAKDGAGHFNDTNLTLSGTGGDPANTCRFFTPTVAGKYDVTVNFFNPVPANITLRLAISVGTDIYAYSETSLGGTGQSASLRVTVDLAIGQTFSIVSGNAAGPDSGTTSIVPAQTYYGTVSITQFIL